LMPSSSFYKTQRPPSRRQSAGYLASSRPMHMMEQIHAKPHLATAEVLVPQHNLKISSTYDYVMQAMPLGQMQHRQGTSLLSASTARIFHSHREKVSKRLQLCQVETQTHDPSDMFLILLFINYLFSDFFFVVQVYQAEFILQTCLRGRATSK